MNLLEPYLLGILKSTFGLTFYYLFNNMTRNSKNNLIKYISK